MEFKVYFLTFVVGLLRIRHAEAVLCYACDHVAHPRDCDRVVECKPEESCNTVTYAQPDGHFYYNIGCLKTASCPTYLFGTFGRRDIAFCNRCCSTAYCNKELCDGPPPPGHGPRCLQCTTVEHPEECGAVTECAQGEMCYTQEKYVFGELRYELGCASKGCVARTFRDVFTKRAGLCYRCCSGENCNRDLCQNTGAPLIHHPATVTTAIPTTAKPVTAAPTAVAPTTTSQVTFHYTSATVHHSYTNQQNTHEYNSHGCLYKGQVYHEGQTWDDNCTFHCTCESEKTGRYICQDICPRYINVPSQCKMVRPAGECCEHPVCEGIHIHYTNFTTTNFTSSILINQCYYGGKEYAQNATWRDGCDFECECRDASRGLYNCSSLCYSWNLPAACHMEPPASGKCCQTPSCPEHYHINYPPGYVAN